jgi:hypothetical protein
MFSTGAPKPKKIASRLQFTFNTAAVSASDDFKEPRN